MDGDKKCPHCAETIKADAKVCRFCHLDVAGSHPAGALQQPLCATCRVALIPIQKINQVSVAGIIGAGAFFIGLFWMFLSVLTGVIIMVVALVIGTVGRGTHTVMTCPHCGKHGATF